MSEYKPKLIEVALPLAAINKESAREKFIRHGHPSTLHLWWARRPLAAARAVLWASLVDDPSGDKSLTPEQVEAERQRLFAILEELVIWENSNNPRVLDAARAEIQRCYPEGPPPILDPFGGGGSIPLEAQRLGLLAKSGDLNPVAVLIQKAMIEIPGLFSGRPPVHPDAQNELLTWERAQGLAADVEAYGQVMREAASRQIGHLYPSVKAATGERAVPIAWIWVRTIRSPNPTWDGHVPLTGSWVLRSKKGKPTVWAEPIIDSATGEISYTVREGGTPVDGTISRGKGTCLATGAAITNKYIREEGCAGRLGQAMVAVVVENPDGQGRVYCDVTPDQLEAATAQVPDGWVPEGRMSDHPQYMGMPRYGFDTWASLFMPRQLHTLRTFADLLPQIRERVEADALAAGMPRGSRISEGGNGAAAYADAVVTYLALNVDRCSVRWNHLSVWETGAEKLQHIFRLNAFQMTWMHADGNPFSSSTGNWSGQTEWIVKVIQDLPATGFGEAKQQDAVSRTQEAQGAVISTDPPYYDNVPYSDLSDFFYVWLKEMLPDVWPDLTRTLLTPKAEELVADYQRHGSRDAAEEFFEGGMGAFMKSVHEGQPVGTPATVFYAYKAAEVVDGEVVSTGWDTFLQGVVDAGMMITATWPIRTEMPGGTRMAGRNVLSSSVVLACRPRPVTSALATRAEFVEELRRELPEALHTLQSGNIPPIDLPQSAIGPGMAIFSRYDRVVEADGSKMPVRRALVIINEILDEVLAGEEAEMDPASRFALAWYSQQGFDAAPFGDADNLARAKNTSVQAVVDSGVAALVSGKLRLLRRDELDEDWDPRADGRLTVWESTQHLVRRLSASESSAAALQAILGGVAERARALAYVLFQRASNQGWAEEAAAYNSLVMSWPTLQALGATEESEDAQGTLL